MVSVPAFYCKVPVVADECNLLLVSDLDKLVDLITGTEPIVLNKDEALVDEGAVKSVCILPKGVRWCLTSYLQLETLSLPANR